MFLDGALIRAVAAMFCCLSVLLLDVHLLMRLRFAAMLALVGHVARAPVVSCHTYCGAVCVLPLVRDHSRLDWLPSSLVHAQMGCARSIQHRAT